IRPQGNICGSSDMVEAATIVNLVKKLVPTATTIGLLYNNGEINSQVQVERLTKELQQQGLQPVAVGVTSEADVPVAMTSLCHKVDVIVLPNDNIMSSSIQLLASLAIKHKKPLIASDNLLVEKGAFAARGVDYYASGAQAANCALEVLKQSKKPYEVSLAQPVMGQIMINKKTAQEVGIILPQNGDAYAFTFFNDT